MFTHVKDIFKISFSCNSINVSHAKWRHLSQLLNHLHTTKVSVKLYLQEYSCHLYRTKVSVKLSTQESTCRVVHISQVYIERTKTTRLIDQETRAHFFLRAVTSRLCADKLIALHFTSEKFCCRLTICLINISMTWDFLCFNLTRGYWARITQTFIKARV